MQVADVITYTTPVLNRLKYTKHPHANPFLYPASNLQVQMDAYKPQVIYMTECPEMQHMFPFVT